MLKLSIDKPYKIYTDNVESGALDQFKDVMSKDWVLRGALMADVHTGYTMPIGGVVETINMISPVFVGYDIGCGVCAQLTSFKKEDVFKHRYAIKDALYNTIPVGQNHNKLPQSWKKFYDIPRSLWYEKMFFEDKGFNQLGTLGGNNHFIEVDYDEEDRIWVTVHSGSRHIGHSVASNYIRLAHPNGKLAEGAYALDVNSPDGKSYIIDLNAALQFALENRRQIVSKTVEVIDKFTNGHAVCDLINRNHNHAESKDGIHWIHRKGATHAEEGMLGVIPGNMKDGSFIVRGKGNSESLYSSSHGAGRVFSRKKAKTMFDVEEVKKDMGDIAANITQATMEESKGAYKNIFEVMDLQKDLVDVLHYIKPIINIKG